MNRKELIKKYIEFFKSKNHKEVPNSSLVPKDDPTVLFTTAGMHPLVPFLLGEKHPQGKRLCNVQRCVRTGDIEEVGDETHHTFFEMLGNWSLGDYFKEDSIKYSFEFLTKVLRIPKEKLEVTCFEGDKNAPKDTEAEEVWKSLGINKIKFLGKKDNWWGPAGKTGPCGPDTEIFVKDVEIWNNVFMQYEKNKKGEYVEANQKNIDTGMGVERTIASLNGLKDNYETDVWKPIIKKIEMISKHKYEENKKPMRIIADHIKASVFIIADGVTPSNTEQGYILRRLIRRAIRYGRDLGIEKFVKKVADPVIEIYNDYEIIEKNKKKIIIELEKEEDNFLKTIQNGTRVFEKIINHPKTQKNKKISGEDAFLLYQSYGFPIEMTVELAKEQKIEVDKKEFEKEYEKHQKLSRTAAEGKFKSGLADNSEATKKLHTATHLLNQVLREVLNKPEIYQKGSNINPERLRFDFNFPRKLTKEELQEVEDLVNEKIKEALPVKCEEMPLEKAKSQGAIGIFDEKYGEKVKVYSIGDFSKELCAGPHVENTKELGHFKIKKEESSSAGVRRIKAVLEDSS